MIPMPPTRRLMEAIPPSSSCRMPVIELSESRMLAWLVTVKSASSP